MDHDEFVDLVPWYVNGTLDRDSRRRLESHLAVCQTCAAAVRDAEDLIVASERSSHPADENLMAYVRAPTELHPAVRGRIERHIAVCGRCADLIAAIEADTNRASGSGSLMSALKFLLTPRMAFVYLALLAVGLPLTIWATRLTNPSVVPLVVRPANTSRSAAGVIEGELPPRLRVPRSGVISLLLDVEHDPELSTTGMRYQVELKGDEGSLLVIETSVHAVDPEGHLLVTFPGSWLAASRRVRLRVLTYKEGSDLPLILVLERELEISGQD